MKTRVKRKPAPGVVRAQIIQALGKRPHSRGEIGQYVLKGFYTPASVYRPILDELIALDLAETFYEERRHGYGATLMYRLKGQPAGASVPGKV